MKKQADCDVTVTCVTYETLFVEGNMMKIVQNIRRLRKLSLAA